VWWSQPYNATVQPTPTPWGWHRSGTGQGYRLSLSRLLRRAFRRQLRWLRYLVRPPKVRFVYAPAYQQAIVGAPLDPLRADRVLAFLTNEGLIRREDIATPIPAALKNVLLAHTPEYLKALERPETLTEILGTAVSDAELEQILDLQRLMAGGTIHATRLALATGCTGVNLGGGFHHAGPARGMGFCVFNDIVIAIRRLQRKGFSGTVLVVDLDLHDGNGTRAAFAADPSVHTFSIHNQHWGDTQAVESTSIALGSNVTDETYLGTLLKTLPPVIERLRPRLVFYLAAVDVAADDRLGNWNITAEGILARDRFVVEQVRHAGAALVVLLGGGYGDNAWRYSARFFSWLLAGRVVEPPDNESLTLLRFRQIKNALNPLHLTHAGESSWELTEEDLVGILPGIPRQTRFLGYFSKVGVELILEQFGIFQQLRARGFRNPELQLELDHPLGQTLRIWGDASHTELLVEVRLSRSARALPNREVLVVEWLLLQNPRETSWGHRSPLPGQTHPGLGMLRELFGWLVVVAETLGLDGLFFRPAHYHIAVQSHRFAFFVDPAHEALFRKLQALLGQCGLAQASHLVETGQVLQLPSGEPLVWEAFPMVLPVSEELKAWASGEAYEGAVAEAEKGIALTLRSTPVG
jgi:acetoin utilization deacetylase AcuC-like enzyme